MTLRPVEDGDAKARVKVFACCAPGASGISVGNSCAVVILSCGFVISLPRLR